MKSLLDLGMHFFYQGGRKLYQHFFHHISKMFILSHHSSSRVYSYIKKACVLNKWYVVMAHIKKEAEVFEKHCSDVVHSCPASGPFLLLFLRNKQEDVTEVSLRKILDLRTQPCIYSVILFSSLVN